MAGCVAGGVEEVEASVVEEVEGSEAVDGGGVVVEGDFHHSPSSVVARAYWRIGIFEVAG